ncbi:MAG TPA: methylmalonate-semialdehyde dehydrogenase (CoA acylating), partial [Nakamurella sp.]
MTTITNPDALTETLDPAGHIVDTVLPHWKGGAPFAGSSSRTADVYDAATGRVSKQVALASAADADAVIAA